MQHIQDKEFDQLIKNKFEEAEIEPSADLWATISPQLENKRKRAFPLYWMAAAAVAVTALTAGLLFNRNAPAVKQGVELAAVKKENTVQQKAAENLQQVNPDVNSSVNGSAVRSSAVPVSELATIPKRLKQPVSALEMNRFASLSTVDSAKHTAAENTAALYAKKVLLAMQPLNEITHLDNEALVVKQQMMGLPKSTAKSREVLMMANVNAGDEDDTTVNSENEQPDEHKGIRNVGDLVNYVVKKVDKRGEKFLQFKTEDDNSSLIAINIGILKFNKKKRKQ